MCPQGPRSALLLSEEGASVHSSLGPLTTRPPHRPRSYRRSKAAPQCVPQGPRRPCYAIFFISAATTMRRQCSVHVIFLRHARAPFLILHLFTQTKSNPPGHFP